MPIPATATVPERDRAVGEGAGFSSDVSEAGVSEAAASTSACDEDRYRILSVT
jgi:hypothetical protein